MDLKKLDEVINKFGEAFINKMKDELDANGSIATGTLKESLNYQFETDVDQIVMRFLSEDYGQWVEQGRKSGTFPNGYNIQALCAVKGLPERAAFPIAKNIFKFGIQPKPFLFQDFDSVKQDFIIALMAVYGSLVKIEVNDMMKEMLPSKIEI